VELIAVQVRWLALRSFVIIIGEWMFGERRMVPAGDDWKMSDDSYCTYRQFNTTSQHRYRLL